MNKDYLQCPVCGVCIAWVILKTNFAEIKEFHDLQCGKPRPMTIKYETIKEEDK